VISHSAKSTGDNIRSHRFGRARDEWIASVAAKDAADVQFMEKSIAFCLVLFDESQARPYKNNFGEWLEDHDWHEVPSKDDRAALIKMGEQIRNGNEEAVREGFASGRTSLRNIWKHEIEPRVTEKTHHTGGRERKKIDQRAVDQAWRSTCRLLFHGDGWDDDKIARSKSMIVNKAKKMTSDDIDEFEYKLRKSSRSADRFVEICLDIADQLER
jgi:hypothetical protein